MIAQGLLGSTDWTIALRPGDLLWLLALGAGTIGLCWSQGLGLTAAWALALGRSLLQLTAVGWLLAVVWAWPSPVSVGLGLVALLLLAIVSAHQQMGQRWPQLLPWVGLALLLAAVVATVPVVLAALRPPLVFDPRAWVPVWAVVLAAAANGVAIAGEQVMAAGRSHRDDIEQRLCLGATPSQAIALHRRAALRAALTPTLNGLASAGLLSLPGVLSGALLGGIDPLMAASVQLLVMVAAALAVTLGAIVVAAGASRLCFDPIGQRLTP